MVLLYLFNSVIAKNEKARLFGGGPCIVKFYLLYVDASMQCRNNDYHHNNDCGYFSDNIM